MLICPKSNVSKQSLIIAQGFRLKASNKPDMVARLARGDVNMPGFPIEKQAPEAHFEAAVYELLRSEPEIRASRLLYYRAPVQHPGPRLDIPQDLAGRRLFVFERAEGVNNIWTVLSAASKIDNEISYSFPSSRSWRPNPH